MVAEAKERPTVAVVGVHDAGLDAEGQERTARALVDAIGTDRRLDALPPSDVARAIAGREVALLADAALGPGRRLLEDGRILNDQAQPEEAVPVLEQAVAALSDAMRVVDASRELWDALVVLGAAHLAAGSKRDAEAAFTSAAILNPQREPDPARLPPAVVEGYRAARGKAAERKGSLTARPDGEAEVWIDGRPATTGRAEEVLAGLHHVRARGADGRTAYTTVEVPQGATAAADLKLGAPALAVPASTAFATARQTSDLYRALGVAAGADLVLVAGGRDGKATAQLYSATADRFGSPVSFTYEGTMDDELIAAMPIVVAAVADDGTLRGETSTSAAALEPSANALLAAMIWAPAPSAPGAPRASRGWIYAVGGAAAAVAVGGGITAAALSSDGNRGTIIVGPVP